VPALRLRVHATQLTPSRPQSKQVFKSLRGHGNYVSSVAFSPSTDQLASGCFDEFVRVWDTRTGTCVRTLAAHSEPVTSVEWGCSGKLLASGSYDGLVRVWDAPSGQCVASLVEPGLPPVGSVRWSPNGAYILASYLDSSVRLWDVLRGKRVKTYTGHSNDTLAVTAAFAGAGADGARIVSGSEDGRVVLWDASSKRVVQELQHPQTVGEGERPLPVLAVDAARHGLDALVSATSGPQGSIAFWTDDSRGREWRWEDEMVV
jgi:COMPASS component SWD3